MERVECAVIGAGVVGIAVARALAQAGREVLVLEAAEGIGTETSSRNSEVIHAGIYYPRGSLMARLCVQGKHMLYDFCRTRGVAHRNCGKLIVATDAAEAERLEAIRQGAAANGVEDLRLLTAAEARAMEPALACTAALVSPSTGIVDSHAYMLTLQGEAEAAGALFVFHSPVSGGRAAADGITLEVGGAEPMTLHASCVINAAGLHAPALARAIAGMPAGQVPTAYYAKGSYFTLSGRAPFSRLVYPVPVPGGLGVHLTIDLGGQARFGPDVEWIDTPEYAVDPARATPSTPRSAATGRRCRTAPCNPAMPACGRRSCRPAGDGRISSCRGRRRMASPALSISSASNPPASPPRSRSPTWCASAAA